MLDIGDHNMTSSCHAGLNSVLSPFEDHAITDLLTKKPQPRKHVVRSRLARPRPKLVLL